MSPLRFAPLALLLVGASGPPATAQTLGDAYGRAGYAAPFLGLPTSQAANVQMAIRSDEAVYFTTAHRDTVGAYVPSSVRLGIVGADGSGDSSFGTDGWHTIDLNRVVGEHGPFDTSALGVAADSKGRAVVVGATRQTREEPIDYEVAPPPSSPFIYRVLPDGSRDPSFSNQAHDVGGIGWAVHVAVTSDRYYVALQYRYGACGVAAFDAHGDLLESFGESGWITFPRVCFNEDLDIDDQGRLVLAMTSGERPAQAFVRRVLPDGSPDGTFAEGGVYRHPFEGRSESGP